METISLNATPRTVMGKQVKQWRLKGQCPAILYGAGIASLPLFIDSKQFVYAWKNAGKSTLVDLLVEGKENIKALIVDVKVHAVHSRLQHVDFFQVDLTKKVRTKIPLKFIGESVAVKTLGGIFVAQLNEVEIECLPSDLVHEISVEVSALKNFHEVILVSHIVAPAGITILTSGQVIVATVQEPRSEDELKALSETVVMDVTQVAKVEKKEKEKDEEEPVEEKK